MERLEFEEHDVVGEDTLGLISEAGRFNEWMYKTIKPFCKGKVLEIGSGIGNISNYLIRDGFEIMLTDIRAGYRDKLLASFEGKPSFLGALVMDLIDPDFDKKFQDQFNSYDTVFALNVVEHIYDDNLAIQNARKLLKEGGNMIVLVPSFNRLFNDMDKELGHYRRYTKSSLVKLFEENKLNVSHAQYFNSIGILGWYFSGKILKKDTISSKQMKIYNSFVPVFKVVDMVTLNLLGLSTIVVGQK